MNGIKNGYYQGNPLKLFDDIEALRPTIIVTVPRILNRIFTKITDDVSKKGAVTQWLYNKGLNAKKYYLER